MNNNEFYLPELKPDDYLIQNADFWKNYRQTLHKLIKEQKSNEIILEKTPKNICLMAEKHGVKAAARYFDITPATVRYYRKKLEENK